MRYDKHNVLVDNPHPQSLAALVLLTKKLAPKPVGYRVWLKYRAWFLKEHKKTHRDFFCSYCGVGPLKNDSRNQNKLVTLDHVKPLAKGGPRFLSSNIVVACHSCNNRKQDKDVEEFISKIV